MRHVKKINSIIKQYGSKPASPGAEDGAGEAVVSKGMRHRLDGALEKAERKRRAGALAQAGARRVQSEVHAAIGLVLDNAAALNELEPVDVLGLADLLKEMLEKKEVQADIRVRGLRLYSEQFSRAVALTMVGAAADAALGEQLRTAGFVRAGQFWSGRANIPEAVRLAGENGLTLLRYDAEDMPVYFVRKGVPQPELAALEGEHEQMMEAARASLPALPTASSEAEGLGNGGAHEPAQPAPEPVDPTEAEPKKAPTSKGTGDPRGSGKSSFGAFNIAKPTSGGQADEFAG